MGVLAVVGLTVAALLVEPWWTLAVITIVYLGLIPLGISVYLKVRRQARRSAIPVPGAAAPEVGDA